jgi:hypothetical protein
MNSSMLMSVLNANDEAKRKSTSNVVVLNATCSQSGRNATVARLNIAHGGHGLCYDNHGGKAPCPAHTATTEPVVRNRADLCFEKEASS